LSKENPPEPIDPDLGKIEEAANTASDLAENVPAVERLDAVENRLASMEPLLEQLQANAELGTKLTDYINDLRSEQVFFNRARYAVGSVALLAIIGLVALLALAIFDGRSPLLTAPPIAIATFVVGLVSGIAFMLNAFVKGVFRSTNERHADGFLPPALEKGLELMNKVTGKH
jgi:hypothetical protein